MKRVKLIFVALTCSMLLFNLSSCVIYKKDNGRHKGWNKNRNNPHNPNTTNPGKPNGKPKGKK